MCMESELAYHLLAIGLGGVGATKIKSRQTRAESYIAPLRETNVRKDVRGSDALLPLERAM